MAKNKKKKRRQRRKAKAASAESQRQREEALRRQREERRAQQEAEERRKKLLRRARKIGGPALAGIAVMAIALFIFKGEAELPGVIRIDERDTEVLTAGETFDYGTPTPTSGPYTAGEARCGVFDDPMPLPEAVAALRVGAVVLWHQPDVDASALADIAESEGEGVVVSPNPDLDRPVVATAWNRLKRYDSATDSEIADFVDTYQNRAPETADCRL